LVHGQIALALGGRVHPMVAWAKLEALAQAAALARKQFGADRVMG
jgi:hypothetical protein